MQEVYFEIRGSVRKKSDRVYPRAAITIKRASTSVETIYWWYNPVAMSNGKAPGLASRIWISAGLQKTC